MKYCLSVLALLPALAFGASTPQDFARGIELDAAADKPLQELDLPDAAYAGITRADLGDLRVFNAAGVAVPIAVCAPAVRAGDRREEVPLPLFMLRAPDAPATSAEGLRIDVRTGDGDRVRVLTPASGAVDSAERRAGGIQGYILDVRGVRDLVGIQFHWADGSDQPTQAQLELSFSPDLQDWHPHGRADLLVRAEGVDGRVLRHDRMVLQGITSGYVRIAPGGSAPLPRLDGVTAILQHVGEPLAARWLDARRTGGRTGEVVAFDYDSGRQAPVTAAEIVFPAENMAAVIALESSADGGERWHERWQGEVYRLAGEAGPQRSPIRFTATPDRYWRVRILRGVDSLAGRPLELRLAYHPSRLRFLAQGEGPWLLAFGSARAERDLRSCDGLLADLPAGERLTLVGAAVTAGEPRVLGGDAVLTPAPVPTPVRRYVLWGVLVLGALVLAVMSLSLLRRPRDD